MNCIDTKSNTSAFLDRQLDHEREVELQQHLSECESCRLVLESEQEVKALLQKSIIEYRAPASLKSKIRKDIAADDRKSFFFNFFNEPKAVAAAVLTLFIAAFLGVQIYKLMQPNNKFDVAYVEDLLAHIECIGCYYDQYQSAEKFCSKYGHSPAIMTENKEVYSFIPNVESTELQEYLGSKVKINGWVFYQSNFIEIASYELIEPAVALLNDLDILDDQIQN